MKSVSLATTTNDAYQRICWEGHWQLLPRHCPGLIEVWDQTVGCSTCGMNIWYLPEEPGHWPSWDAANEPPPDWWSLARKSDKNPYDPYVRLFDMIHPFKFEDCHDPGDEDRDSDPWPLGP